MRFPPRFAPPLEVRFAEREPLVRFAEDDLGDDEVRFAALLFARFPAPLNARDAVFFAPCFAELCEPPLVFPPVFLTDEVFLAVAAGPVFAEGFFAELRLPDLADGLDLADERVLLDLCPPVGLPEPVALGITFSAAAAMPPIAAPAAAPPSISPAASITLSRMPLALDLFERVDLLDAGEWPRDELVLSAMIFLPCSKFKIPSSIRN